MDRRLFLSGLASTAAAGAVLPSVALADFSFTANIDSGFADDQYALIDEALHIVVGRFTDSRIVDNMYEFEREWSYRFSKSAWHIANLHRKANRYWRRKENFLEYQLINLDLRPHHISVRKFHRRDDTYGEAVVGTINRKYVGDGRGRWDGSFEVYLNAFHVNSDVPQSQDPNFWATVIAHEMLHNLGHRHGNRDQLYQMIAFEHCFYHNGSFRIGDDCPKFGCGLRIS